MNNSTLIMAAIKEVTKLVSCNKNEQMTPPI